MIKQETCWECGKLRERCKAVTVNEFNRIEYVCPQCFRNLDYAKYLYDYRLKQGDE